MTPKQKEITRISDRIAQAIAQHKLPPGTRLVEAQIVEAFAANRNHVRAALQRLAMQRIINIEPNRGAMVAQPSVAEAREVFTARRAIERAVTESISPEDIQAFQQRIEDHMMSERRAALGKDRQVIVRELSQFHLLLGEISGNSVLIEILQNLITRSSLIVALYQRNDVPACASDEHQNIINALAAGDKSHAVELMLGHLDEIESQLELSRNLDTTIDLRSVFND
ncbi:GntR family transcriptional regulator [Aestuariirhabdus sp. LZHN29]|uniref:GntR family transcriptional regulator n=1 Tax=Aestuariirhabdus sp. LZHN29 TaxID=3417462 RepID=UPI003CFA0F2D